MTADKDANVQPVGTLWLQELSNAECGMRNAELSRDSTFRILPEANPVHSAFHQVGPEATAELAQAMGLDDPGPVLERFAGGRSCYIVRVEGVLVSYGWVSTKEEWISELGLHIHLLPGDAYIWDCATLPAYRGRGLYPALLIYILRELCAQGLRRAWIGADTGSVPSQKGIIRAGFQPIADFVPAPAPQRFIVIGRPGAPEELVQDARDALLDQ